jgi:hypothetical protein
MATGISESTTKVITFPGTSGAVFNKEKTHRYALWRRWDSSLPMVMFIGLNPSRANEHYNDPTITRCVDFAVRWGYGGMFFGNLFGFRSPFPADLVRTMKESDAVGEENDANLQAMAALSDKVVFAWGSWPFIIERTQIVRNMFPEAFCFGYNKGGWPKHPLYLKKTSQLIPYKPE